MEKTTLGLEENIASLVCYAFGWVSGLIVFLIEKENKTVRFHALQSLVVFGALSVAQVVAIPIRAIPFVGALFGFALWVLMLVLWIVLMVKAYQGEKFRVPIAAEIAEKHA